MEVKGKALRFAVLIRVSTEKQEKQGESLRTQKSQLEQAVAAMGGIITKTYAGQEHGTAGYERKKLDELLADAAKKSRPFDAVIVADPSRWSRDNVASEQGLETLRDNGVRFFVLGSESNLFDPTQRLFLSMSSVINAFQATVQKQKSILNRIEREKRGIPTAGKKPFGRTRDRDKQVWVVDPEKQAMIVDVANRYLAGESLPKLAKEVGMNHSYLCKVLRDRCGEDWNVKFQVDDLNIKETITHKIPRLLPEATIKKIHQQQTANRTYVRSGGVRKHDYLLSGHIICGACGYTLSGQTNHGDRRYYRHPSGERVKNCPLNEPRPWVSADEIESLVVGDLFDMFGNPAAIERAVRASTPDCDKVMAQRDRVDAELAKLDKARGRVLGLVRKDLITDAQADKELGEIKERETLLMAEREKLSEQLINVPDSEQIRIYVEQIDGRIFLRDCYDNEYAGGNDVGSFLMMTEKERRNLITFAFGAPLSGEKRAGVYVMPSSGTRHGAKQFTYELRGQLLPGKTRGVPRSRH